MQRLEVLELKATRKFSVFELISPPQVVVPFTDLTSFVNADELRALDLYLAERDLFNFQAHEVCVFAAACRKHGDAIELHTKTGWPDEYGFEECRRNRGNGEYWRPNANAARLPGLVAFVARLPFFERTGKVTIILSAAGSCGAEHVDHKFDGWVSEFVWLRVASSAKRFYVRGVGPDPPRHYVGVPGRACVVWFDDHLAHCIAPAEEDSYSIRIDGVFTPAWRKRLAQVGQCGEQVLRSAGGLNAVLAAQRFAEPPPAAAAAAAAGLVSAPVER